MKRIWILMLLLVLIGCLPKSAQKTAEQNTRIAIDTRRMDSVLIPLNEAMLASFDDAQAAEPFCGAQPKAIFCSGAKSVATTD